MKPVRGHFVAAIVSYRVQRVGPVVAVWQAADEVLGTLRLTIQVAAHPLAVQDVLTRQRLDEVVQGIVVPHELARPEIVHSRGAEDETPRWGHQVLAIVLEYQVEEIWTQSIFKQQRYRKPRTVRCVRWRCCCLSIVIQNFFDGYIIARLFGIEALVPLGHLLELIIIQRVRLLPCHLSRRHLLRLLGARLQSTGTKLHRGRPGAVSQRPAARCRSAINQ